MILVLGSLAGTAYADIPGCLSTVTKADQFGNVKVVCTQWASGGTDSTTPPAGNANGTTECTKASAIIPCTDALGGRWNGTCYVLVLDPQPAREDPRWNGQVDGVLARCYQNPAFVGASPVIWLPGPPDAGPSPRELADRAVASMRLSAGEIGVTPLPESGAMGIVNMPMWLWVANPGESTTGPITRSSSTGSISVTATATLDRVVYAMGDGHTVTCGPGTPYDVRRHGGSSSPDCGYTYAQSSAHRRNLAYTITATSSWTVTWTGGGQSGTITLDFSRSIPYRVGEIQVLLEP